MQQLLDKSNVAPKFLARGEKVEGKIVSTIADTALVDIGAKSEGIIPIKELEEMGMKTGIGEKISAIVAQSENDSGMIILTVKKGQKEKSWEDLNKIVEEDGSIDVKGVDSNRGGMIVEYNGIRGFIPSQHLISNARESINKKISVKILEVNKNLNRLVLSEKEVSGGETLPKIDLAFKIGDVLQVQVAKMLPFGLLVSIDKGSEGLIHISEVSWNRVENLADAFKVGDKLKAKVISIDPSNGRVNLSLKKLEKDPWEEAAKKYKVGTAIEKEVSRVASYGIFVQLEEGIEGLLHSSKIPYGTNLKIGDKIKVSIDLFNSEQRRVALRLAQEDTSSDNKESKEPRKAKLEKTTDKVKAKVKKEKN